jgi:hypothetical protein
MAPLAIAALAYGGSKLLGAGMDYMGRRSQEQKQKEAFARQQQGINEAEGIGNKYYDTLEGAYAPEAATYVSDLADWRKANQQDPVQMGDFDTSKYNVDAYLDPSMAYQQEQMRRSADASAAHGGFLGSSAQQLELQKRASALAQTDYGNAFARMGQDRQFGYGAFKDKFEATRQAAEDKINHLSSIVNQSGTARNALFDAQGKRADLGMKSAYGRATGDYNNLMTQGQNSNANWQSAGNAIQSVGGAASQYYTGQNANDQAALDRKSYGGT